MQLGRGLQKDLQSLHKARTLRKVRSEGNPGVDFQSIGVV